MAKISLFLTGGTGFFGRSLLRYCLNLKDYDLRVLVLSRDPRRFLQLYPEFDSTSLFEFIKGDVQQSDTLPWDKKFTHVLHAATDSTLGPTLTPLQRYDQIVVGTRNILELAQVSGASRFLLTSSGAIYGPQPIDLVEVPEDWPEAPHLNLAESAYGQAKRADEHLCAIYREMSELEVVIARCFTFVGPDLPINSHFAVENFVSDALNADKILVKGDGTSIRSYLDQRELAHWLWVLLFEGLSGEAYNVGSNKAISISRLAHLVRDLISQASQFI